MITLLATSFTLACVVACVRRLRLAIAPTSFDPATLLSALRGDSGRARFEQIAARLASQPEETWERALIQALRRPREERAALVNEQLGELDHRAQRWARVPRVCASIASSAGFLLASLALRNGLSDPAAFAEDTRSAALAGALTSAVNVATIGIAGAAFCVAAQMRAVRAARARREATDKLVERLESLASS